MPVRQWLSRFTSVRRRKVLRRKRLLPAETGTLRSAEWLEDRTLLSATDLLSYVATTAEHLDESHEHGDGFGDISAFNDSNLTERGQSRLPDLPGLILVDPDTDVRGQIIYLDFDGAQGVTYNGPVTVGPFDVPAFEAPGELAGYEDDIIADVVAELQQTFADSGVTFTTDQPAADIEYSTIYIGGDDSAFQEFGSFLGLAEHVDVGNALIDDAAFVFAEQLAEFSFDQPVVHSIADVVTHETGHLLGFRHAEVRVAGRLADQAAKTRTFTTVKRGYLNIGGFGFQQNVMNIGFHDRTLPFNNSVYRAFAYFDLTGLSNQVIDSAEVSVTLSSVVNDTPSFINMWVTNMTWDTFSTSKVLENITPQLTHFQDSTGSITSTLTFDVLNTDLLGQNEVGFILTASPEAPVATRRDDTNYIQVHSPVLSVTHSPIDTEPDPFSFRDYREAFVSTLFTSSEITVTGVNLASPISVFGNAAKYRVNGGAWTAADGTVNNGDKVEVQQASSSLYSRTVRTTLNIGGVTDDWEVTTQAAPDTEPDLFDFRNQADVRRNVEVQSNTITVSGINQAAPISVSGNNGHEYRINGGVWRSDDSTVTNGDQVQVQQTSSSSYSTPTTLVLTIGGVADTFTVTTESGPDESPPEPNPSRFLIAPYATGATSISMTAQVASDPSGVEYYFEETTGRPGGSDSGWQQSRTFVDAGLQAGTTYSYRVKTRDRAATPNEGTYSSSRSATTQVPADTSAPTPNPIGFSVNPYATGTTSINMTAQAASDPSGVEYYFEETTGRPGGSDSGWQSSRTYMDTGLQSGTTYSYRVKTRDRAATPNEGTYSSSRSATTQVPADTSAPTPNPIGFSVNPYATGTTSISMTAQVASDPSGVEYYFEETTGRPGGSDSGWQPSRTFVDTGLQAGTTYSYRVKTRDRATTPNEGVYSSSRSATTQMPVSVTPVSLPYSQEFSMGRPGPQQGWEYYSSGEGRVEVVAGALRLDDGVFNTTYSLNEAVLHLDLEGQSGVTLTFDHQESRDENTGLPQIFQGHEDGDGVSFSSDGSTWYRLVDLMGEFTNRTFDLDAAINAAGIPYSSDFHIKFQQYDNTPWGDDGRSIDNIVVTSAPPIPVVQIVDDGNSGFSQSGYTYFPAGFGGDTHFAAAGSGTSVATWTFPNLTAGAYRVSATWNPHSNRATNAPYQINGGAAIRLNQELPPSDGTFTSVRDAASGVYFADIHSAYRLNSNGSLVVRLTNLANEYVIADAIRIERVGSVVAAPEIEVLDGSTDVPDGGTVNVGSTTPGSAITKTLTVRNAGTQNLTLTPLSSSSFSNGFSLVNNFSRTTLAPGQTSTFTVQFVSSSTGTRTAAISFSNNDGNESPFDLTLRATVATLPPTPVVQIVDDGNSGFSQSGYAYFPAGFGGDTHFAAAGSGTSVATWTFPNLTAGVYRVSATWDPHSNRATNAPYQINGGAAIRLNQELPPSHGTFTSVRDAASGVYFADIHSAYRLNSNGSLVVRLTNLANEYVIADAIRIERVGSVVAAPEIEVLDGSTDVPDGGTVNVGSTTPGSAIAKTLTVRNAGTQNLTLTPLSSSSFSNGFSLVSNFSRTTLAPGQTSTFTVRFVSSSTGTQTAAISFSNNDGNESPFDLTLRATVATLPPTPVVQIVDDGNSGFSQSGYTYFPAGYGGDTHFAAAGSGTSVATWTFPNLTAGVYRVSATWDPHSNRATNAPYQINGGAAIRLNQELPPSDGTFTSVRDATSGSYFADIHSAYRLNSNGSLVVRLTNLGNEYVIADAIRIERVGSVAAAPEIEVLDGSTDVPDGGTVNVGSTTPGSAITKTLTVRNSGTQNLTLTPLSSSRFSNGFSLVSNFSRTTLAPGQTSTFTIRFVSSSTGTRTTAISFSNNDGNESPFDLTLRATVATLPPTPVVQIVDDGNSGFSQSGYTYFPAGYGGDTHFAAAGSGTSVATWTFPNLTAGVYRVSATWDPHRNRATNAPYQINGGAAIRLNQELPPSDGTFTSVRDAASGSYFADIHSAYHLNSNGSLVVRLTNLANEYVIADAIRIERIGN